MSTQIKLDRVALRHLIDSDPDFKLELQRAVLAEVVRNLFQKDIRTILEIGDKAFLRQVTEVALENETIAASIVEQMDKMLIERVSNGYYNKRVTLSADLKKIVEQAVEQAVLNVRGRITLATNEAAEKAWETHQSIIDKRIETYFNAKIASSIDAEVHRRVNERLAAIAEGITA